MSTNLPFAATVANALADDDRRDRVIGLIQSGLIARGHDLGPTGADEVVGPLTEAAWASAMGGDGVDRSLRLPDGQYIGDHEPKSLIVLHHTAGGSLRSTVDWWRTTPERIGTAYMVSREGAVHELFDPRAWAYHTGTTGALDRRSIGIEICSEGGLSREDDGELHAFGGTTPRTIYRGEIYDHGRPWRGYRYFAAYTEPAIEATIRLVDRLCGEHGIARVTPGDHLAFDPRLTMFRGVVGHHHVRGDKSDLHPGFPWGRLVGGAALGVGDG